MTSSIKILFTILQQAGWFCIYFWAFGLLGWWAIPVLILGMYGAGFIQVIAQRHYILNNIDALMAEAKRREKEKDKDAK